MRIVITALLCETDEHKKQVVDGFAEEGLAVTYVGQYNTLPGQGGPGGRTDVLFDLDDKNVPKAAIHPWHLSGMFRWADDYWADSNNLVPPESHHLFDGYKHYERTEQEIEEDEDHVEA